MDLESTTRSTNQCSSTNHPIFRYSNKSGVYIAEDSLLSASRLGQSAKRIISWNITRAFFLVDFKRLLDADHYYFEHLFVVTMCDVIRIITLHFDICMSACSKLLKTLYIWNNGSFEINDILVKPCEYIISFNVQNVADFFVV